MSERAPVTADEIRSELIGLGTIEIDPNGSIVANRQRHGHVAGTRVGNVLRQMPGWVEWLLRELDHRDRVVEEKNRRIAELERLLDAATRTEETEEFTDEHHEAVSDVSEEH